MNTWVRLANRNLPLETLAGNSVMVINPNVEIAFMKIIKSRTAKNNREEGLKGELESGGDL